MWGGVSSTPALGQRIHRNLGASASVGDQLGRAFRGSKEESDFHGGIQVQVSPAGGKEQVFRSEDLRKPLLLKHGSDIRATGR